MNVFKIVLGFIILFASGAEYINAGRQIGSFHSPVIVIMCLLSILLATWLIGSGFTLKKFKFKSFNFIKFLIISIITFLLSAFFNLGTDKTPTNIVKINGLEIPLGDCLTGNKNIIPELAKRKEYCNCLVEKITNQPELKQKFKIELENNKILDVLKEVYSNPDYTFLNVEDCMNSIDMNWTDQLANSMKSNWKQQLKETEFEQTNNVEIYCDCLNEEYRKFPLSDVMKDEFMESPVASEIMDKCSIQSLR